MGSRNRVLTEEQKLEVVNEYQSGLSTPHLAKKYGVHSNAIRGILLRRNIKLRSPSKCHRKYYINEDFFDNINSQEKAYVLGIFYADGSNNIRKHKAYISLAEKDVDIVKKIRDLISPNKPLLYSKRNPENIKHQNRYMFYIDNKHMSEQLEKIGCITNKTFRLKFPKWLNKDLYNHFIRGYFDGDGHIGIYKTKTNKIQANFSIVSTEEFCTSISEIFKELDINSKLYCRFPESNNSIRDVRIGGNLQILRLLDWLYKDASIYMNRKYQKYLELKSIYKQI